MAVLVSIGTMHQLGVNIGDSVILIERDPEGLIYDKWPAKITRVCPAFIETVHQITEEKRPELRPYNRAYEKTWTKHYGTKNLIL